jgi:hypothetical protein
MTKVQKLQRKTNTELLSSNKRRKPLKGGKPVVFDEKEREYPLALHFKANMICREFLTGFRKRNLELKKAKKEKYEKKIKEEKLQKRREVRCFYLKALLILILFRNDKS